MADYLALPSDDVEILRIAASFHDTGYCHMYTGHEDRSIEVAVNWLQDQQFAEPRLLQVISCIQATRFPQSPKNDLDNVLCDADFFHFASTTYEDYEHRLRKEWELRLGRRYTNEEWARLNCEMMMNHRYFTRYGQEVLQPLKVRNIEMMRCRV